jgi:hypothetical protein
MANNSSGNACAIWIIHCNKHSERWRTCARFPFRSALDMPERLFPLAYGMTARAPF